MKIGFTGSRNGTTDHQRTRVRKLSHDDHMHWHARRFHVVGHVLCARAITVVNRDQSVAGRGELAVGDQARSATEFAIWFDVDGWGIVSSGPLLPGTIGAALAARDQPSNLET